MFLFNAISMSILTVLALFLSFLVPQFLNMSMQKKQSKATQNVRFLPLDLLNDRKLVKTTCCLF